MAKNLFSKSLNDEVHVQTPTGRKIWYINSIEYIQSYKTRTKLLSSTIIKLVFDSLIFLSPAFY